MRFGVRGRSPGQLQRPTGVTVDMNGDIIVADYDNRWISIFSSDGKFKVNIFPDRKKKCFLQDKFKMFEWITTPSLWSQNKIGAGRLMGPKGVAVDKNGHIITVDNKACCVFIFQSNGKLVTKFGARGTSDRHFAGTVWYFIHILMKSFTGRQNEQRMMLHVSLHVVGPDLQILFMFHSFQECWSAQKAFI